MYNIYKCIKTMTNYSNHTGLHILVTDPTDLKSLNLDKKLVKITQHFISVTTSHQVDFLAIRYHCKQIRTKLELIISLSYARDAKFKCRETSINNASIPSAWQSTFNLARTHTCEHSCCKVLAISSRLGAMHPITSSSLQTISRGLHLIEKVCQC